jgi:hypothetical protein
MGSRSPFAHLSTIWVTPHAYLTTGPHYTCLSHRSPHSQQTNQTFPQLYSKQHILSPLLTPHVSLPPRNPKKTPKPKTPIPVLFAIQRKTPKFPQCNKSPTRDPIFGGFTCTPLLRTFPQNPPTPKILFNPSQLT